MSEVIVYDDNYYKLAEYDWDFADAKIDTIAQIHPYPARFIGEIPETLIKELMQGKSSIVMDPFCGSGTTLVAAQKNGYKSVGIDLNPIACLQSKVKTSLVPNDFLYFAESIVNAAKKKYGMNISIPAIPNLDHWFKKDIQVALSSLLDEINKVKDQYNNDLLRISLSSIIVRVSNQESDTRYAAIEKDYTAEDVYNNFLKACKKTQEALSARNSIEAEAAIIEQDVLTVNKEQIPGKVGLIVTSPPYPNAYEYWLYHKYRMWWLGLDPINVRTYEIGCRPKYHKKNGETEVNFYNQMDKVFDLFVDALESQGHIGFVVGRSIIRGKEIDNTKLISEVAKNKRLVLCADIKRNIASTKKSFNLKYGKINTEDILIFRKD